LINRNIFVGVANNYENTLDSIYCMGSESMFFIGDGIFYPKYSAGYIVNIEEKEIYGVAKKYYVIKLIINELLTMIPMEFENSKRLRKVIEKNEYEKIVELLNSEIGVLPSKWGDRYKLYNKYIEEGDIYKLTTLIRDIYLMPRRKEISKSDMKTFDEVLCMIASELSIVLEIQYEEMKRILIDMLNAKC
jgi:CarD family transcriptional regulator